MASRMSILGIHVNYIKLLFLISARCRQQCFTLTLHHGKKKTLVTYYTTFPKLQSAEYVAPLPCEAHSLRKKSALKTRLSQKSGINMRGFRGDLIVSSAAGPRFHNKAWWGTHAVAVVTHNFGHIFPTTLKTLFVDRNASSLLSEN